jgi:hypothetical protein
MHYATDVRFLRIFGKTPFRIYGKNTMKYTLLLFSNNKTFSVKAHCTIKEKKIKLPDVSIFGILLTIAGDSPYTDAHYCYVHHKF